MDTIEIKQTQEKLLALLPHWNYRISKPFKQLLDEGISLEMYYFLQILRWRGGLMPMSEIAAWVQMQKQQMTKMVNRLVDQELVNRVYDPSDRRIIKIQITDKATDYIDNFLNNNAEHYQKMLASLSETDFSDFKQAIDILIRILPELPCSPDDTSKNFK